MTAVFWEPINHAVFFVKSFFRTKGMSCQISFKKDIVVGKAIDGNSVLFEIQWSDGSTEDVFSPVVGDIASVNDRIDHGRLHSKVQQALTMRSGAVAIKVSPLIPKPPTPPEPPSPPKPPR